MGRIPWPSSRSKTVPSRQPPGSCIAQDQAGVAGLVLLALLATVGWWIRQGGLRGSTVEFERAKPQVAQFEVDINSADWPELLQLPSIGETLARRIVESRERDGPFLDHKDLRRVRGIGPKTLETIRPYLRPLPERGAVAGQSKHEVVVGRPQSERWKVQRAKGNPPADGI